MIGCALLAFSATAVAADPPDVDTSAEPQNFDNPAYITLEGPWESVSKAVEPCRDEFRPATKKDKQSSEAVIHKEVASPVDAELMYAVDIRQNGCSMILVKDGQGTIRPLPSLESSEPEQIPVDDPQ